MNLVQLETDPIRKIMGNALNEVLKKYGEKEVNLKSSAAREMLVEEILNTLISTAEVASKYIPPMIKDM